MLKNTSKPKKGPKVKTERLGSFARELATLVDAGVQLATALRILTDQEEDKPFKVVLEHITRQVSSGESLSNSFAVYPETFPNMFVSLLRAGEASGEMIQMLNEVAQYLENEDKLRKRIKSATTYPKFIMGFFLTALIGVMTLLIPHFQELFESFDAELPGPTQMLMDISTFVKGYIIWELSIIAAIYMLLKFIGKTDRGKVLYAKILLSLPVIGPLVIRTLIAKFTSTLGVLISNSVSIVDAIDIAAETSDNVVFKDEMRRVNESIKQGNRLSHSLSVGGLFPPIAINMISVGEEVGSLDTMLKKVTDYYGRQIDEKLTAATSLLEPMIMVLLGGLALVIVIALYLPIFKISSVIH